MSLTTRQHFIWGWGRLPSLDQGNRTSLASDDSHTLTPLANTPKLLQALETTTSLRSINAGQHSIVAVTNSGELYSWGTTGPAVDCGDEQIKSTTHDNSSSDASHLHFTNHTALRFRPVLDMQDKGVYQISMQNSAMYAITASNEVYGWKLVDEERIDDLGDSLCTSPNDSIRSLLTGPSYVAHMIPTLSLSDLSAASIACGSNMMLILTSAGLLYSFGKNSHGRLGLGHTNDVSSPTLVDTGDRLLTRISAGYNHAAAITNTGLVLTFGCGLHGRLGNGRDECDDETRPTRVHESLDCPVVDVACGYHHTLCLDVEGRVWSWGGNQYGQGGCGPNPNGDTDDDINDPAPQYLTHPSCLSISDQVVSISAGAYHSACITSLAELLVFGQNRFGALGTGTFTNQYFPVVCRALSGMQVVLVSTAADYTVAVTDHFMSVEPNYFNGESNWSFEDSPAPDVSNQSLSQTSRGASLLSSSIPNTPVVFEESSLHVQSNNSGQLQNNLSRKPSIQNSSSPSIRDRAKSASDLTQRSTLLALVKEALLIPPVTSISDFENVYSLTQSTTNLLGRQSSSSGGPSDLHSRSFGRRSTSESRVDSAAISKMNDAYLQKLQRNAREAALQRAEEQKLAAEEEKRALAASRALVKREKLMDEAATEWTKHILPNWHEPKTKQRARDLVSKNGIPAKIRGTVWPVLIGNSLMINPELYRIFGERAARFKAKNNGTGQDQHSPSQVDSSLEDLKAFGKEHTFSYIDVDVSRTFPQLAFFQRECAIHEDLRHVLYTYCFYRPDVGYIQGISYISAVFLLYMPCFQAFSCFANLLNSSFFHAFLKFQTPAIEARYSFFYDLLKENNSQLHHHLVVGQGISADMFYLEWCMTLFSKRLKLEVVSRVWDLVVVFGELAVHKTSVAILLCLKSQLMQSNEMSQTLKLLTTAPMTLTEENLMSEVNKVQVSDKMISRMRRVQTQEI